MKKTYFTPTTVVEECLTEEMIAASSVSSNNGIGYGGIDEDGSLEAAARQFTMTIFMIE